MWLGTVNLSRTWPTDFADVVAAGLAIAVAGGEEIEAQRPVVGGTQEDAAFLISIRLHRIP